MRRQNLLAEQLAHPRLQFGWLPLCTNDSRRAFLAVAPTLTAMLAGFSMLQHMQFPTHRMPLHVPLSTTVRDTVTARVAILGTQQLL